MSPAIVHRLEPVQVEHQHRKRCLPAQAALAFAAQQRECGAPVAQPRQCIL
jgi:hypothetical protein